jgi:hypothetical protein
MQITYVYLQYNRHFASAALYISHAIFTQI